MDEDRVVILALVDDLEIALRINSRCKWFALLKAMNPRAWLL